ncbi:citrate synthase [Candidatus Bathyarchaeota archaeon A05DMB-2]|jgi:citrate synthase|nr:citrate synthase [Candidatus Bathyarchaeota archaeon A05DMB-2]
MNENHDSDKVVVRGLRDVAAAETKISFVDPNGALYYLGYSIDDLVERVCYEEVAYLLLNGKLPNKNELDDFRAQLISEMNLPEAVINSIKSAPLCSHPMEVLRTEVSHLGMYDPDRDDNSEKVYRKRAIRLVAKVPTIVAAHHRLRINQKLVTPKEEFGFAENFLYMFRGIPADSEEKIAIDRFMTLHADHGFNASTFAARVTASTNSGMYSAVTSAIGTLKGPLHGGASEKVMLMLDNINTEEEVEEYIQGMLDDQKKIMGFGHRVYKTEDPRTKHLRVIAENLCHRANSLSLYSLCLKIENVVHEKKKIFPNVDFYAAVVLNALRVPKEYFTPFFASSRIAGWTAHIIEQYQDAVLLRPSSKYVGEFGRTFVPIENR